VEAGKSTASGDSLVASTAGAAAVSQATAADGAATASEALRKKHRRVIGSDGAIDVDT